MAAKPAIKNTTNPRHRKLTMKDIRAAAKRLSNWGRWGKDDEIGTLNYVSAQDIIQAAQLVRKGKLRSVRPAGGQEQVSLARALQSYPLHAAHRYRRVLGGARQA
jgi:hypothetical protein